MKLRGMGFLMSCLLICCHLAGISHSAVSVSIASLLCLSSATGGGAQYSMSSMLSILADPYENPIRTIIFADILNRNDTIRVVRRMDEYFYDYLRGNFSNSNIPGNHQGLKDIMFYSSEISINFMKLLDAREYIQKNPKLQYATVFAERVINEMLAIDYLRTIRDIIVRRPTNSASFTNQSQGFTDISLHIISEPQHTKIFLQFIRWMMTKLYEIVIFAHDLHMESEDGVTTPNVMAELVHQYSMKNIITPYTDILEWLRGDIAKSSLVVLAKDFEKHIINETYYEIMIFKRMFVEKCRAPISLSNIPHDNKKTCSQITSAPKYCDHLYAGQLCPVWQTCGKVSCTSLEESTTVCKSDEELTGIREYEYHLPSYKNNTRGCSGFYWLEPEKKRLNQGYPIAICSPCECICQKRDKPYYYSTEMVTTDTRNNMIVVGARFKVVEDTLAIEVQQGKLLQNGIIDPSTITWLPVKLGLREEISLKEMNAIDLTRVTVPQGDVITGLSLHKGHGTLRAAHRIRLCTSTREYNFRTGALSDNVEGIYYSGGARFEVERNDVISANRSLFDVIVRDKFVKFTVSDGRDGGKTTLPLFDARKVAPDPHTPLSGAGLYLRRKSNGSLIGIELLTFEVTSLLLN